MTKPWETWRVGRRVPRHIYRSDGPDGVVGTLDREEDARLAACAPELARALVALLECCQPDTDARAVIRVSYGRIDEIRALLTKAGAQ